MLHLDEDDWGAVQALGDCTHLRCIVVPLNLGLHSLHAQCLGFHCSADWHAHSSSLRIEQLPTHFSSSNSLRPHPLKALSELLIYCAFHNEVTG